MNYSGDRILSFINGYAFRSYGWWCAGINRGLIIPAGDDVMIYSK